MRWELILAIGLGVIAVVLGILVVHLRARLNVEKRLRQRADQAHAAGLEQAGEAERQLRNEIEHRARATITLRRHAGCGPPSAVTHPTRAPFAVLEWRA